MKFRGLRAVVGAAVAALVLTAGQSASAAPPPSAGPGWALVLYSTAGITTAHRSAADTLYLVAPSGLRYPLAQIPDSDASARLIAWSGDGTRALAELPSGAVEQITLAGGQMSRVSLPTGVTVLGYSRPDGLGILGESTSGGVTTLARYTLGGALARVLATWPSSSAVSAATAVFGTAALEARSGRFVVVPGSAALTLVSSHGGASGVLPLPVSSGASCAPVRWWTDDVVLAECSGPGIAGPRLWLVPTSGDRPAALTPQRGQNGPDYGDINGWRLDGALYVQALASCGPPFIALANQDGTATPVLIPGVVVAQAGQWLLTEQAGGCADSTSLLWFNPVTRAERWVFRTPAADAGVISAAAFAN
jgi:hypothetical protein